MTEGVADVLAGGRLWWAEQGDVLPWLASLPADCAALVFASPPYERARLYLEGGRNLGIARDTEDWVRWMAEVCGAARRVCVGLCGFVVEGQTRQYRYTCSPFLLAADLHRAGFHLRKPAVYQRYGIAGSGGPDFLRNDWEPVLCFGRGGKLPWSDNTAMGRPPKFGPRGEFSHRVSDGTRVNQWGATGERSGGRVRRADGGRKEPGCPSSSRFVKMGATRGYKNGDTLNEGAYVPPAIANPGNVVACKAGGGNMGSKLCHEGEAPFPERLAEFFVRSFCPPGGLVIDPFCGSGTTLAVAVRWGRRALGCDLRQSQVDLTRRRLAGVTPDLFETPVGETPGA